MAERQAAAGPGRGNEHAGHGTADPGLQAPGLLCQHAQQHRSVETCSPSRQHRCTSRHSNQLTQQHNQLGTPLLPLRHRLSVRRTQERQFKPVPFGFPAPPSAFTLASAPEHAAVWEHFRSIDSDKEARVLQVCRHVGSHMQAATMHTQHTGVHEIQADPCWRGPKARCAPPCHTQHMRLAGSALCRAQPVEHSPDVLNSCVEQPGQCEGASICHPAHPHSPLSRAACDTPALPIHVSHSAGLGGS